MAWRYLDLADYLLIAEAVTGLEAEVLAKMPRVVNLASSDLKPPASRSDHMQIPGGQIERRTRLGGLLSDYRQLPVAA